MAEFARGAEKRILHRFFRGTENVADSPQFQSLIMLHFKNNALARRQALHGGGETRFDFFSNEGPFRVQRGTLLTLALEEVRNALLVEARAQFRSLIFGTRLAASEVVQTNVGNDAVEPGVKAALEAESVEIAVNLEECFLVNVPGVLGALHEIQRQTEHVAVVAAHQFLESCTAACLR